MRIFSEVWSRLVYAVEILIVIFSFVFGVGSFVEVFLRCTIWEFDYEKVVAYSVASALSWFICITCSRDINS